MHMCIPSSWLIQGNWLIQLYISQIDQLSSMHRLRSELEKQNLQILHTKSMGDEIAESAK